MLNNFIQLLTQTYMQDLFGVVRQSKDTKLDKSHSKSYMLKP